MMNRWFLRLSVACVVGSVLVFFVSWLADLAGWHVRSLMSEAGVVWFLQHWSRTVNTEALLNLVVYTQAIGFLVASGLAEALLSLLHPHRSVTYSQRITLSFIGLIMAVLVALIIYNSWHEDAPFRSVDGTWGTMPLVAGRGLVVAVLCNLLGTLYGFMSEHFISFRSYITALPYGFQHSTGLPLLYVAASTLYVLLSYAFYL